MGAKTWMLVLADSNARGALAAKRPLDRGATQNLADTLFPGEKLKQIVSDIKERHEKGQPVLVGTVSIEKSEELSVLLTRAGVPHNVLNAKHHEKEAGIIVEAGTKGKITIATNMAGRGTDIQLGPGVSELGGLYVLGTERHESRRIDNQLRGRSGRQGERRESGRDQGDRCAPAHAGRPFTGVGMPGNLLASARGTPGSEPSQNSAIGHSGMAIEKCWPKGMPAPECPPRSGWSGRGSSWARNTRSSVSSATACTTRSTRKTTDMPIERAAFDGVSISRLIRGGWQLHEAAGRLDRAAALVKPGGALVYCTCSLEPEEGERAVAALLERNPGLQRSPIAPAEVGGLSEIITPDGAIRSLPCHLADPEPQMSGLDGFYAARIVRV